MNYSVVWQPDDEYIRGSHLERLIQALNLESYDELYKFSIEHTDEFWRVTLDLMGIEWLEPFQEFVDLGRGKAWPRWFVGGKTNLAHNALRRAHDPQARGRIVLRWEGEDGAERNLTYAEVEELVGRFATGLKRLGVVKGDRVGLYLPMIPEAIIAYLAIAQVGAIAVPVFSGYGTEAILTRLKDAEAKVLITADGFYRRGRPVPMKRTVDAVAEAYTGLEKVVVVRRLGMEVPWRKGRDVSWDELISQDGAKTPPLPMDPNDPFLIIYTSGTTGKPKGTVHYHGGLPFKSAQDAAHLFDLREGETLFWVTDMGWVMGPIIISAAFTLGATLVIYEGAPNYPSWNRFFEIVERHGVTHLGASPTLVRKLKSHADRPSADLSSLRVLISTGEAWDSDSYLWFFEEFGQRRLPIINYSGGTEISGGILGNVVYRPIKVGGFNTVVPGIKAAVLNEAGRPVRNQVGELAVLEPFVGMTQGFWRDSERYLETYWNRFEGIWVHGDLTLQDEEGHFFIQGRSDDTLKIAGKRIGPAEVEDLITGLSEVAEAVAIGAPHPEKGEELVVFVVLAEEIDPDELKTKISALVEQHLGKAFRPDHVITVPELPKTRTGKLMRRVVRRVYLGESPGDLSSMENPAAIEAIRAAREASAQA